MTNYRAHLAVVGHSKAGKTRFICNLLDNRKSQNQCQSWAGVRRYFVRSTFYGHFSNIWIESQFDASLLEEIFNNSVLKQTENIEDPRVEEPKSISQRKVHYWKVEPNIGTETSSNENTGSYTEDWINMELEEEEESLRFPENPRNDGNEVSQSKEELSLSKVFKMSQETLKQLLKTKDTFAANSLQANHIPYSISIWEHSNQGEFMSINNPFLNTGAVSLIVMNICLDIFTPVTHTSEERRELGVPKFGYPKTPAHMLCYWLNLLQDHAEMEQTQLNFALVLTHKDMIPAEDPQQYIDNYIGDLLKCVMGKPYASYITRENIFIVDNKTEDEDHLAEIRSQIFKMITKQKKNWGTLQPVRWLKLEADILKKAAENESLYLNISIIEGLASEYAITKGDVKPFLNFQHILGDLIYYPDPKLRDVIIINPQWLWDMINSLITPDQFFENRQFHLKSLQDWKNGIVSEECLEIAWKSNREFLKNVMMKFGLIKGLEADCKYFIPCVLPLSKYDTYETEPFRSMILAYHCFLRPGCDAAMSGEAFHRLLSECSKISNWRSYHLSYNDASLEISDGTHIAFTLMRGNTIRVSVWCYPHKIACHEILYLLYTHYPLSKRASSLGMVQDSTFLVLCPHWNPNDECQCLVRVTENEGHVIPRDSICAIHHKTITEHHFPQNLKGRYTQKQFLENKH